MSLSLPIILSSAMITSITLASNPATLSIWLILTTCMISITLSFSTSNWFSLILFLIYVGGMLVMFSYFIVIQPNQHLEMKKMLTTMAITSSTIGSMIFPLPMIPLPTSYKPSYPPFSLIMPPMLSIFVILALTLFLALIAVVKIANLQEGPLRPFKYV